MVFNRSMNERLRPTKPMTFISLVQELVNKTPEEILQDFISYFKNTEITKFLKDIQSFIDFLKQVKNSHLTISLLLGDDFDNIITNLTEFYEYINIIYQNYVKNTKMKIYQQPNLETNNELSENKFLKSSKIKLFEAEDILSLNPDEITFDETNNEVENEKQKEDSTVYYEISFYKMLLLTKNDYILNYVNQFIIDIILSIKLLIMTFMYKIDILKF